MMRATYHNGDIFVSFTADAECQGVGADGSPAYNAPVNIQIEKLEMFGLGVPFQTGLWPTLTRVLLEMAEELEFTEDCK
jgi:hypothetical protein